MRVSVSAGVVLGVTASGCGYATILLAAAVITCFGCFLLSCDLILAVDSCVLLVAAAGWDADELAVEGRCSFWKSFGDRSIPLPLSGPAFETVVPLPLPT